MNPLLLFATAPLVLALFSGGTEPSIGCDPSGDAAIGKVQKTFLPFVEGQVVGATVALEGAGRFGDLPATLQVGVPAEVASGPVDWFSLLETLPGLDEALAIYFAVIDPEVPLAPKAEAARVLLYLVSAVDQLPDTLDLVGQIDDAVLLGWAVQRLGIHLTDQHRAQARAWLTTHGLPTDVSLADLVQIKRAIEVWTEKAGQAITSGSLGEIVGLTPGLTELVAMFYTMIDPSSPWATKGWIAMTILGVFSPADLVPDWIPIVGQLDDAAYLTYTMSRVAHDVKPEHMQRARAWLLARGIEPTAPGMPGYFFPHAAPHPAPAPAPAPGPAPAP